MKIFLALLVVLAFWHPGQALANGGTGCFNQGQSVGVTQANVNAGQTDGITIKPWDDGYASTGSCADTPQSTNYGIYIKVVGPSTTTNPTGPVVWSGSGSLTLSTAGAADPGFTGMTCNGTSGQCNIDTTGWQPGTYYVYVVLIETSQWANGTTTYDVSFDNISPAYGCSGTQDSSYPANACADATWAPGSYIGISGNTPVTFTVQVQPHQMIAKAYPYSTASGTPCASSDSSCGTSTLYITPGTPVSLRAGTTPTEASGSTDAASSVFATITAPTLNQVFSGSLSYSGTSGNFNEWVTQNIPTTGWATSSTPYPACFKSYDGNGNLLDTECVSIIVTDTPPPPPPASPTGSCTILMDASPNGNIAVDCLAPNSSTQPQQYSEALVVCPLLTGGAMDCPDATTLGSGQSSNSNWFGALNWNGSPPATSDCNQANINQNGGVLQYYPNELCFNGDFLWSGQSATPGGQQVIGWTVEAVVYQMQYVSSLVYDDNVDSNGIVISDSDATSAVWGNVTESSVDTGDGDYSSDLAEWNAGWTQWTHSEIVTPAFSDEAVGQPDADSTTAYNWVIDPNVTPCTQYAPPIYLNPCLECNVSLKYGNATAYGPGNPGGGSMNGSIALPNVPTTLPSSMYCYLNPKYCADPTMWNPEAPMLSSVLFTPLLASGQAGTQTTVLTQATTKYFNGSNWVYPCSTQSPFCVSSWSVATSGDAVNPTSVIGGAFIVSFVVQVPTSGGGATSQTCIQVVYLLPPVAQFTAQTQVNASSPPSWQGAGQTYTDQATGWKAVPTNGTFTFQPDPTQITARAWYIWGPGTGLDTPASGIYGTAV